MADSDLNARRERAKRRVLQIFVGYIATLVLVAALVWAATSSIVWGIGVLLSLLVLMPWVFTALRVAAQRRERRSASMG